MNNIKNADVLIVGGGIMGSATAYYLLKQQPDLRVVVVERDSSYEKASTARSDGNQRVQFNLKENIQMSLYGQEVYTSFAEDMAVEGKPVDIGFRQEGNLFLVNEAGKEAALQGLAQQQSLGAEVHWLEQDEVKACYPFLNVEDCVGATFGPQDGTLSPLAMLLAYRNKAQSLGASYLEAVVATINTRANEVTGVTLQSGETLGAPLVLASAGAWVTQLLEPLAIRLPIQAIKRQVYFVKTYIKTSKRLPLLVLPTGNYLHHEAEGNFITGGSLPDDPETFDDFHCSQARFEEHIWPTLAAYLPDFEQLKIANMWAGLYARNSLDGNGIIGEWPEFKGLYLANGFSGHGLQQCHAVGRYLSELMLGLRPHLDLSRLGPERILTHTPVVEHSGRLI